MALVTSTEMFKKAYNGGYAIGAFNVNNMEIVQGITEACREEKAPVILQVSKGARAYANHTYLVKLVEYAHDHGVVVEAELGALAGVEDEVNVSAEQSHYTRPEEVEEFVSKTGCDSLAIAIGTSHGAYKFTAAQCTRNEKGELVPPPLRFDILDEVVKRLPGFPIVLHGSSSVPQDYVKMVNARGAAPQGR